MSSNHQPHFDGPVTKKDDDMLNRWPFAEALGKAIVGYQSDESIVVGLYGPWGSGKTSVAEMSLEHISETCKDSNPIIVRFNPWNFSGQSQLVGQFFSSIRCTLELPSESEQAKNVARVMRTFSAFFSVVKYVPGVSELANVISTITGAAARGADAIAKQKEQDFEEIKSSLAQALSDLGRPIIVLIDDIDRLTPTEICQTFQLVKSVCNLPYMRYLLVMDREAIEAALETIHGLPATSYLQKIVQVPYTLPEPSHEKIRRFLFDEIALVLGVCTEQEEREWKSMCGRPEFLGLFQTLRDVKRFINILLFEYGPVSGNVNPYDFVALTAVKVCSPGVYDSLLRHKRSGREAKFVHSEYDFVWVDPAIREDVGSSGRDADALRLLIGDENASSKEGLFFGSDKLESPGFDLRSAQKKVCMEPTSHFYFSLCTHEDDLSPLVLDELVLGAINEDDFELLVRDMISRGRQQDLIRGIHYRADKIPEDNIGSIICVLTKTGIADWDKLSVLHMLRALPEDRRYAILQRAFTETGIEQAGVLCSIMIFVNSLFRDGYQEHKIVSEEQAEELDLICLEKIRGFVEGGSLVDIRLSEIFSEFKRLAPDEARVWIECITREQDHS